jgi:hypothetical protein
MAKDDVWLGGIPRDTGMRMMIVRVTKEMINVPVA